jgi:hypothetical protein
MAEIFHSKHPPLCSALVELCLVVGTVKIRVETSGKASNLRELLLLMSILLDE